MKGKNNLATSSLKLVFIDVVGDLLHWPFWWYTRGIKNAGNLFLDTVKGEYERLGVGVWLKNLFVPMFGQYDWQGRLISFFARLVQLIVRSIILFFWLIVASVIFLLWLIMPIYIFYQIVDHFQFLFH